MLIYRPLQPHQGLRTLAAWKRMRGRTLDFVLLHGHCKQEGKAPRTTLSGTSCRIWQYCSYIYSPNESQWSGMTKVLPARILRHSGTLRHVGVLCDMR
jgi:hypothetical protein